MRVLIFGDSITQGFWDVNGGWVNILRKQYDQQMIDGTSNDPPTIFNLGVSGDSSIDVLMRFDNETKVRAKEELAFIIAVGVNDARTKAGINFSDVEQYKQNLIKILGLARRYSQKILFVGLTPCDEAHSNPVSWGDTGYTNGRIKEFDNVLHDFCNQNKIHYVEIFEHFMQTQAVSELFPDSLHPSSEGHELIANLVRPKLEALVNKV